MPKFLTKDEVYRVIQRELPEDVYPDGPATAYYHTSDVYSVSTQVGKAYDNLERIYDNLFPQSANEQLTDWEIKVFGAPLSATLTLQARRDMVLAKIRSQQRIRPQDMIDIVHQVIPSAVVVEIAEWGCHTGGWMLDESQLDIETILNFASRVDHPGQELCGKTPPPGISEEDWRLEQQESYTYEVRIYDYVLSATELEQIEALLNRGERASAQHIIIDNLPASDMLEGSG